MAKSYKINQNSLEDLPILGGLFANPRADDKRAQKAMEQGAAQYDNINIPILDQLKLEDPNWLADYQASQSQYEDMGPTAFDGLSADPRLKDQQMAALASLQGIANNGGFNAADEANLNRIQGEAASADKGRRDAIKQGMQQRGMAGSGLELLNQLQSNQAATDRQAQQGLDVAGMAQSRALQAMQQSGQLAGGMRDQDFGEQARVAQARDAISQFNAVNRLQNNQFNVGQTNQAGMFNNQGRQNTANAGVDNRNQAAQYNAGLGQQNFGNQMAKANGVAGAYGAKTDYYQNAADRKEKTKAELLGVGVKGAAAAYGGG